MNVEIIHVVPGGDSLHHDKWSFNKSRRIIAGCEGGDVLPVRVVESVIKDGIVSDTAVLFFTGSDIAVKDGGIAKDGATLVIVYGPEAIFATEGLTIGRHMSFLIWTYKFARRSTRYVVFAKIISSGESLSLIVEGSPFVLRNLDGQIFAG